MLPDTDGSRAGPCIVEVRPVERQQERQAGVHEQTLGQLRRPVEPGEQVDAGGGPALRQRDEAIGHGAAERGTLVAAGTVGVVDDDQDRRVPDSRRPGVGQLLDAAQQVVQLGLVGVVDDAGTPWMGSHGGPLVEPVGGDEDREVPVG